MSLLPLDSIMCSVGSGSGLEWLWNSPLTMGFMWAGGICLGAAAFASLFSRRRRQKRPQDKNQYWNSKTGQFVASSTPLVFETFSKIEQDNMEIAYLFQGAMVRISTKLPELLSTYSSYLYHLYDTCNKDPVLMQQRLLHDLKDTFPTEHIVALVAFLVHKDKSRIRLPEMQPAIDFFGVSSLHPQGCLVYEDWLEEQSEALYFHPHPFMQLDPLFDKKLATQVVHISQSLPRAVLEDTSRQRLRCVNYTTYEASCASSCSSSSKLEAPARAQLRDLAAVQNDYLACIRYKGQYAYLQRALTSWRTKSQIQRDPVGIHNVYLMHLYGLSIHVIGQSSSLSSSSLSTPQEEFKFQSRKHLIYYEAVQFLLGSPSSLTAVWKCWNRCSGSSSTDFTDCIPVPMPSTWLGPPVLL